jgi:hypothetical protein
MVFNRQSLNRFIRSKEGKNVTITFVIDREQRTTQENRYYWGVVIDLILKAFIELGHEATAADIHELLKVKFNNRPVCDANGLVYELPLSTADLTVNEFELYIERIKRWAAENLNLIIPDPNKQHLKL